MLAKQIYCILVQYCILIAVQYCGCKRAHWDNRVGGRRTGARPPVPRAARVVCLGSNHLCLRGSRRSCVARDARVPMSSSAWLRLLLVAFECLLCGPDSLSLSPPSGRCREPSPTPIGAKTRSAFASARFLDSAPYTRVLRGARNASG